jgi:hypothetical protein
MVLANAIDGEQSLYRIHRTRRGLRNRFIDGGSAGGRCGTQIKQIVHQAMIASCADVEAQARRDDADWRAVEQGAEASAGDPP